MVTSERRTAFITGAASGIGLETTRRFAEDPRYNPIFAVDRNPRIQTIFSSPEYSNIVPVQLDVRDRAGVSELLQRIIRESGRLDVVVNAAGLMVKSRVHWSGYIREDLSELEEMQDINYWAPVIITHEAAQIMGEGGTIVNVSSAKYLFPDIYHIDYQGDKMDLSKVTRRAAKTYKDRGIRVVDLQPGNTKTNIDNGDWTETADKNESEMSQIIADWWREHFGNDPRNVAEIIHKIADGKIKETTVPVGIDTKVGMVLLFATYPLAGFRSDHLFFMGSTIFYKLATLGNRLRLKF